MSPHSLADCSDESSGSTSTYGPAFHPHSSVPNGSHASVGTSCQMKSNLRRAAAEEVHDLVCVGFGPASLAIAVALHDALNAGTLKNPPRAIFLEKQGQFAWHAGMLLPGAKMQISFIKDMASLRDPRSNFTFLNYLHNQGRLVEFTNLGTFLPARVEYEDYLRWCAEHFSDVVRYHSEVVSVLPEATDEATGAVRTFAVSSKDARTGEITTHRAHNVVLAIGGQPSVPKCLPARHPRVVHSSQYAHLVPKLLKDTTAPYRVAVLGAGQSAAEIFNNIQTLYPNSRTSLIMRSEFLRPSDDSPFVNSIFNPTYVDSLYNRTSEDRHNLLSEARVTNYGVVRLELIERLYERMYEQRRELGTDESKWPHRILGGYRVAHAEDTDSTINLRVRQTRPGAEFNGDFGSNEPAAGDEIIQTDLVIAATGYQRDAHVGMLRGLSHLLPERTKAVREKLEGWPVVDEKTGSAKLLEVGRDYQVRFAPGAVSDSSGVWLQGCCEGTHGLSDTLLSVLATRSGEIVASIFGSKKEQMA